MCALISLINFNGVLQPFQNLGNISDWLGRGLLRANWVQLDDAMYFEACFDANSYRVVVRKMSRRKMRVRQK